ncbi:11169_t:CDS:1, partial [Ambispora gerdemannii]
TKNIPGSSVAGITFSKEAGWKFTLNSLTSAGVKLDADLDVILVFVESSLGKERSADPGNLPT